MSDAEVSSRMREDWNARAREDAGYYVAFGRRDSDDAEFFATATEDERIAAFQTGHTQPEARVVHE